MKAVIAQPAEDTVDLLARIRRQFNDSAQLKLKAHDALAGPIARATEIMVKCLLANGKILACGNGGSAADAQHFSAELLKPLRARASWARCYCADDRLLYLDRDRKRLRIRAGIL